MKKANEADMQQREITLDPVTRLEGHGKIEIFLDERGEVERAYLHVPELRGFEVFSLGRPAEEMPLAVRIHDASGRVVQEVRR